MCHSFHCDIQFISCYCISFSLILHILIGMNMLLSQNEDTIAALATAPGIGAISVIRVSGPLSFSATEKIFNGKSKITESHTHTIHYGKISQFEWRSD